MRHLLTSKEFINVCQYFETIDFTKPETYNNWLAQTYYFVCHSVKLTALAVANLPVDDKLANKMAEHLQEETGHHLLALHDLNNMKADLQNYPELGVTKAFYESQYYKVQYIHPHILLGQILMLEALSAKVGPKMYDTITKKFGKNINSFVKVHATVDIKHSEEALMACEFVNEKYKKSLEENFYQACFMYSQILNEIQKIKAAEIAA